MCMLKCTCMCVWDMLMPGDQETTYRDRLSSTMWALGTELRWSGLGAVTFNTEPAR